MSNSFVPRERLRAESSGFRCFFYFRLLGYFHKAFIDKTQRSSSVHVSFSKIEQSVCNNLKIWVRLFFFSLRPIQKHLGFDGFGISRSNWDIVVYYFQYYLNHQPQNNSKLVLKIIFDDLKMCPLRELLKNCQSTISKANNKDVYSFYIFWTFLKYSVKTYAS